MKKHKRNLEAFLSKNPLFLQKIVPVGVKMLQKSCIFEKNMSKTSFRFYKDHKVRAIWDEEHNFWWFSVLDIVGAINEQDSHEKNRNYWKYLKSKLKREGSEVVSATTQLFKKGFAVKMLQKTMPVGVKLLQKIVSVGIKLLQKSCIFAVKMLQTGH